LGCQSELSAACIVICKLICKVDHLWYSDILWPLIWDNISRVPTVMH
jgi:hypothetical protein